MTTTKQIPVQFTKDQITHLRSLSSESGRSIAALVREAVDRMFAPTAGIPAEALWLILRDPANWQTFKTIALTHEATITPVVPPKDPDLPPTWRHKPSTTVPPRPRFVEHPIEDPFA